MPTLQAPTNAFKFGNGEVQFAKVNEDGSKTVPVKLVARSGQPINHWYWGRVVHDMAGMRLANEKIPLDWNHSEEVLIGYADKFSTETGDLVIEGELVSTKENDKSDEIIKLAKAGVPFSSSIYFDSEQDFVTEELSEGMEVEVNGNQLVGPVTIIRKWMLRGVAITPHGYDWRTPVDASRFDASSHPEDEATNVPAELTVIEAEQDGRTDAEVTGQTEPVIEEEQTLTAAKEEPEQTERSVLATFVARFGAELGSKWLLEEKTYQEALELYVDELGRKLKDKEEENSRLNIKLASISVGEAEPLSTSTEEVDSRFAHLGPNLSKFASSIKLSK